MSKYSLYLTYSWSCLLLFGESSWVFHQETEEICSRFKLVIRNHCIDFKMTSL